MKTIGSIGLGAMGGSYAKFLIEDNYTVYGVCLLYTSPSPRD